MTTNVWRINWRDSKTGNIVETAILPVNPATGQPELAHPAKFMRPLEVVYSPDPVNAKGTL